MQIKQFITYYLQLTNQRVYQELIYRNRPLKKCVQAPPPCLSPAPAGFSHFLLLNDFPPPSRSLEQAKWDLAAEPSRVVKPREISFNRLVPTPFFWNTAPPPKLSSHTHTIPPATQAIRLPAYGVSQKNNDIGQAYFFSPLPLPSFLLSASHLP